MVVIPKKLRDSSKKRDLTRNNKNIGHNFWKITLLYTMEFT